MAGQDLIDVRDMAIVHRTFERLYAESAQLVRRDPAPSAERASFLADHIDFGVMMLHHHHENEDALLYPKLIERAPDQAATTEEIEHEHELVRTSLEDVSSACTSWRTQPTAEGGEALATSLDQLNTVLKTHAADEERDVVPLAARTLTQDEWDSVGKQAVAKIPAKWKPIAFGALLEPLDESDRAYMKGNLPAPIRMLFPVMIDRPWRRYAKKLRGTT
jgi:hemerythrin-like domain-containing protein